MNLANANPIPKSKGTDNSENVIKRHGAVLGLCSLILSQPYDVSEHMPDLLVRTASFINDPQPIKLAVKDAFADFWR